MKNDKNSTNELQNLNQNSVDYDCMHDTRVKLMYLINTDKGKMRLSLYFVCQWNTTVAVQVIE